MEIKPLELQYFQYTGCCIGCQQANIPFMFYQQRQGCIVALVTCTAQNHFGGKTFYAGKIKEVVVGYSNEVLF